MFYNNRKKASLKAPNQDLYKMTKHGCSLSVPIFKENDSILGKERKRERKGLTGNQHFSLVGQTYVP